MWVKCRTENTVDTSNGIRRIFRVGEVLKVRGIDADSRLAVVEDVAYDTPEVIEVHMSNFVVIREEVVQRILNNYFLNVVSRKG